MFEENVFFFNFSFSKTARPPSPTGCGQLRGNNLYRSLRIVGLSWLLVFLNDLDKLLDWSKPVLVPLVYIFIVTRLTKG